MSDAEDFGLTAAEFDEALREALTCPADIQVRYDRLWPNAGLVPSIERSIALSTCKRLGLMADYYAARRGELSIVEALVAHAQMGKEPPESLIQRRRNYWRSFSLSLEQQHVAQ